MAQQSAGVCLYRFASERPATGRPANGLEVLIAHPGGPYWAKRNEGAWTFPKGEFDPATEDPFDCAIREFCEETGFEPERDGALDVGTTTLKSRKVIYCWAIAGDLDPTTITSNHFELEWPPRSGTVQSFPEIDRVEWVDVEDAARLLNPAQVVFVERLRVQLGLEPPPPPKR